MRKDLDGLCGVQAVNENWIKDLAKGLSWVLQNPRVILFGSRAIVEHATWNDYGLCVISPAFTWIKPWTRPVK